MNCLGDTSLGHFLSPMNQKSLGNEPGTHFPVGAAWGMGQGWHFPSLSHGTPSFTAPLGGRGSHFCISFPCSFRRFWCVPSDVLCPGVSLAAVAGSTRWDEVSGHCCVLGFHRMLKFRSGPCAVSGALCVLTLPLLCSLCLPSPCPGLTLPAQRVPAAWSASEFSLSTDSAHGFSRGSQLLVFVAFWFYSKGEARKFPSSLQNVAVKRSGFISLS